MSEYCKQFSTKVILGTSPNKSMVWEADGKPKPVYDLYTLSGIVTGSRNKESTYGQSTKFTGEFEALNLDTGELYQSNNYYAPSALEAMLLNQLASSEGKGAKFGVIIGIKPNPKAKDGYEYVFKPIVPIKENDAMSEIRRAMEETRKLVRKVSKK